MAAIPAARARAITSVFDASGPAKASAATMSPENRSQAAAWTDSPNQSSSAATSASVSTDTWPPNTRR